MDTKTWSALAETNRLHIVVLLREGPLTVGEIADRLRLRQPQASKHLGVLLKAGIVELHAVTNRRIYKLRPEPFKEMDAWLGSYRRIWNESFDRFDVYFQEFQEEEKSDKTQLRRKYRNDQQ
jgi:DNA-binding transcriptional ArsR family regulator